MGKTNPRRNKVRPNPIGALGTLEFGDEDEIGPSCHMGPIDILRSQLLNANVEEKINGLQSLAIFAGSRDKVHAIVSNKDDILSITSSLLCENDMAVRNAAAGALRNLSVCGAEVCDVLVEKDILTPLIVLLCGYIQDLKWTPKFDASLANQLDLRSDVFLQSINLLWHLCESSTVAIDNFNQSQLLDGLIRCLDFKIFGLDIALSVAQCLLVVSENNPKSWNVLNTHVSTFLYLLDVTGNHEKMYLRTLAAGILANVPAFAAAYSAQILNSLSQTLKFDHRICLNTVTKANETFNTESLELEVDMEIAEEESSEAAAVRRRKQELPTTREVAIRDVGYLLDAQRVAAEIITNLCGSNEDEWVDSVDDETSESENIIDSDGMSVSESNLHAGETFPQEIIEAFKSLGIIDDLWQKAQPFADSLAQSLRDISISLYMKVKNLRISSLICLQNMCNTLRTEDFGGSNAIYNVWVDLGKEVFKGSQDPSILEPSTSLMRSALEHLKSDKELFSQMSKNDLELILHGVKNCSVPEIRANWLRMLGSLGCLLPEILVKIIVSFIIETCGNEEDVWTISEALDAMMDMFADNDWDQIVLELNLPKLVKELEKNLKTKMRQQKRDLKERYPAVQTVSVNFSRFVKYLERNA